MDTKTPFFSVVTPVYNGQAFLSDTIESVLAQTDADWEMVIVNDCSKDRSGEIAESFSQKDPRIRVLHNERNLRIAASLNRGCAAAKGKWIVRLDSDDCFRPSYLAALREVIEKEKRGNCFFSSWITVMDEKGESLVDVRLPDAETIRKMMKIENFLYHPATSFSKSLWNTAGGYTESGLTIAEDTDMWLKFFEAGARLVMIPQFLVRYRVHYSNATSVTDARLNEETSAKEQKAIRQNREWRISLYLKQKELKRARREIIDLSKTFRTLSLKNLQYFFLTFLPESVVYFFMWEVRPRMRAFFKALKPPRIRI